MRINADFMKSKSDHWATPSKLYKKLIACGYVDPCPLYSRVDNLNKDYKYTRLFINPPFSQIDKWVDFALRQYRNGCDILFLMPSRTDTKYFHKLLTISDFVVFFKGRFHFNDSKSVAPFPVIIVECTQRSCVNHLYASYTLDTYIDSLC